MPLSATTPLLTKAELANLGWAGLGDAPFSGHCDCHKVSSAPLLRQPCTAFFTHSLTVYGLQNIIPSRQVERRLGESRPTEQFQTGLATSSSDVPLFIGDRNHQLSPLLVPSTWSHSGCWEVRNDVLESEIKEASNPAAVTTAGISEWVQGTVPRTRHMTASRCPKNRSTTFLRASLVPSSLSGPQHPV